MYSIIIPTHNRHEYLYRSMEYFSLFHASIIYLDSSEEPFLGKLPSNVFYYHLPDKNFTSKCLFGINKCENEYIAFCADDDFLIENALIKGVKSMIEHHYSACVGSYLFFDKGDNKLYSSRGKERVPSDDKKNDVAKYMSDYYQILYAIFPKDEIKACYELTDSAGFDSWGRFTELLIANYCAARGGIYVFDDYFGIREVSTDGSMGSVEKDIRQRKNSDSVSKDINKYVHQLSKVIGAELAELGITAYLSTYSNSNGIKNSIKTIIPDFILKIYRVFKVSKVSKVSKKKNIVGKFSSRFEVDLF